MIYGYILFLLCILFWDSFDSGTYLIWDTIDFVIHLILGHILFWDTSDFGTHMILDFLVNLFFETTLILEIFYFGHFLLWDTFEYGIQLILLYI